MLRLRMFAGPNGSGKSTLQTKLSPSLVRVYINPDDIEKKIRSSLSFDFNSVEIQTTLQEINLFFSTASILLQNGILIPEAFLQFSGNSLLFKDPSAVNSYVASALADFIRQKLLEAKKSFSFETVMSFPDKIALLRTAQDQGYKTYLYYVATEDPAINVVRVAYRVQRGGHSVPQDKITSRYYRSLELLLEAINASNRAYIFDNSGVDSILIAIITDGRQIEMKHSEIPNWFKKWVLNKLFVELEIPASM